MARLELGRHREGLLTLAAAQAAKKGKWKMEFQCENCGQTFKGTADRTEDSPQGGTIGHAVCPDCQSDAWELDKNGNCK